MKRRLEAIAFAIVVLSAAMLPIPKSSAQEQSGQPATPRPLRPVHTFSIVARDPVTGELGVAVQSHWFSVGPIVPWAEPGVGAVATQANAEVAYGPRGLERLRGGA